MTRHVKCADCNRINTINEIYENMQFDCVFCGITNTIVFTSVVKRVFCKNPKNNSTMVYVGKNDNKTISRL